MSREQVKCLIKNPRNNRGLFYAYPLICFANLLISFPQE